MKVKDLIDLLSTYSDDTEVYIKEPNDLEKLGYTDQVHLVERDLISENVDTYDAFDGIPYNYKCIRMAFNDEKTNSFKGLIIC